ncbi:lycopene beta-cyclase CrtY [Sphingomonas xinjiangensis]|uniref:Lycopene beta-cyclase n=1 Tax=Sphingomonas xinjiangensis TaxID=643568 RepID=A0A840YQD6_9SPHN|nr:lycopene beta-cyclase CrtY [Sphingomonas xinjiangensis]MBB5711081.1 lycopene beta-cyclase [Sphingomonas xinjiangensis]
MSARISCDVAIVGGGLAGGLIALALRRRRPDLDVRVIEGSARLGGNHLWSFFATDIDPAHRWLVAPLIGHGWARYDVAFPEHVRTLKARYYSIESSHFDRVLRRELPRDALLFGRKVVTATPTSVQLAGGDLVEARGVIDCRGAGDLSALELGWQKFLGRELALSEPHGISRPMVMDATVPQIDGYRFVYTLPFTPTRLFVEDTYYSDTPEIDTAALGERIDLHAARQDWHVEQVLREEAGALPVVMGGNFDAYWRSGGEGVAKAGVRAGLFHPLTSYSLPDAVRTAALVAEAGSIEGAALHTLLHGHARRTWRARGFYRMLSRMLFKAAEPEARYKVLERFYRLDAELIARFYAGQSSAWDRVRVLSGKPPVPIGRAVQALRGRT